jgi:hypothetical protein
MESLCYTNYLPPGPSETVALQRQAERKRPWWYAERHLAARLVKALGDGTPSQADFALRFNFSQRAISLIFRVTMNERENTQNAYR